MPDWSTGLKHARAGSWAACGPGTNHLPRAKAPSPPLRVPHTKMSSNDCMHPSGHLHGLYRSPHSKAAQGCPPRQGAAGFLAS